MFTLANHLTTEHDVQVFGQLGEHAERGQSLGATWRLHRTVPRELEISVSYLTTLVRGFRAVRAFDPDLVLTQHQPALIGAVLHRLDDTPHVVFLRDFEALPEAEYGQGPLVARANRLCSRANRRVLAFTFANADLVVADSEFTAERYHDAMAVDPAVVYEFVDGEVQDDPPQGEKIAHVTPTRAKGIDVTLDVAECMSDEAFVVVGNEPAAEIRARMSDLPNVEYAGYVADVGEVYRKAKVVLMPSTWDEPFGRVPVEAGLYGTPTLCSGNGGLPESAGVSEFIVESNEASEYVERIETVDADYQRFRRLARENAEAKLADEQVDLLKSIVKQEVGVQL